jgi:hypothetical protein
VDKLSLRDREAVLAQLTTDGWLAHVADRAGCYTLGVRPLVGGVMRKSVARFWPSISA